MRRPDRRVAAFAAFAFVCTATAVGYVATTVAGNDVAAGGKVAPVAAADSLAAVREAPHVVFRTLAPGEAGRLAVAPLDAPDGPRTLTGAECLRAYATAEVGLCLHDQGNMFTRYEIGFLGRDLDQRHRESLSGLVSRARISPDGRHGAATVFVTGHSYAQGGFSTETTLHDMATGDLLGGLEQFEVYKDGGQIKHVDFNFWGVTFTAEPGRFYATLGTEGHTYLVRGDIDENRMEVLRDGVECPSLSPDGTRIAFKQRVDPGDETKGWRPAVLDVATLEDHPLSETRNVDDQIEWLNDDTVLYAVDTGRGAPDVFAAAADGTGTPRLFLTDADSPAVVRP
ncbi:MAG: hypothetical protein ACRDY7_03270 [Acidimicrobiia bacterium]